jgi:CubicO group peptidase (beta-lactamase class C family)
MGRQSGPAAPFIYSRGRMDALGLVASWPVDNAAVGVVGVDGLDVCDSVGSDRRLFRWASCTKPATALAVLIASEEGTLALDEPAGPAGSTVRHLLAHASGLGPEPGPPIAPPGVSRIYSNAGYLVLAGLISERAGMEFADYLSAGVLEPLGMTDTVLDADAPSGPAAAGLSGPLRDLLSLGRELAVPTLISEGTHRAATSVSFPDLAGVLPGFQRFDPCDWGLGVELRGHKRPHWTGTANSPETFGHFGRTGSFLWVDPVAGLICGGLSDRPFGQWAVRSWPRLADAVLAEVAGGPSR